jgi:TPR repeat protein
MFNLGRCYAAGNGLPAADVIQACKWYQQAANLGHVEAQYNTVPTY